MLPKVSELIKIKDALTLINYELIQISQLAGLITHV